MNTAEHVIALLAILVIAALLHLDYRRVHRALDRMEAQRGARHDELVVAIQGRRRLAAKPEQLFPQTSHPAPKPIGGLGPWL